MLDSTDSSRKVFSLLTKMPESRRKRLQLSCGECRKKKLSCDRKLPCQRCVRSGRPEQCSFETGTKHEIFEQQAQHNSDEIRDLRAEVAQLRGLLSKAHLQHESDSATESLHVADNAEFGHFLLPNEKPDTDSELSDPRKRSPNVYYSQHTLFRFFVEIPQLFPFVKETVDEWLKPLGVHLKKNKPVRIDCKATAFFQEGSQLESLLPSKDDTDALVFFYLNNLEQIHHVVHIPTFKREYANFWLPERTRYSAMMALILSMISISTCASPGAADPASIPSRYRAMPTQWISACDEWLRQQSSKNRKLVHHQVSCLVYLAKRMNILGKKRWWKDTGSLIQNAVIDELHCDPSPSIDSPYVREMRKRIWLVLRELDLQNTFDYGLPTLLYNIDSNVADSANIDDEDIDETSKVLPMSKPPNQYTYTSYQLHSSRSWSLRLEISRHLFSTGASKPLSYEKVLQYTHEITQAMNSLPPWDIDEIKDENGAKQHSLLAYAFLRFQLVECILALHRPYLQRDSGKFWLSENICYEMSRDTLLMNSRLAKLGIQSLTFAREDLLLVSLCIIHITMLQPKGSNSIIINNAKSTIDLLEQCLPLMEDRYLRCFSGEPWCFITMCAAIMLLKTYLAKESWQTAKSLCAQRFLDLHYKHKYMGGSQQDLMEAEPVVQIDALAACQQIPAPDAAVFPSSGWLDSSYSDIGIDSSNFDMELDSTWESWGSMT